MDRMHGAFAFPGVKTSGRASAAPYLRGDLPSLDFGRVVFAAAVA